MENKKPFDTKSPKIIDTIECNGKYKNVSTMQGKIIAAGSVLIGIAAFIGVQIFCL